MILLLFLFLTRPFDYLMIILNPSYVKHFELPLYMKSAIYCE